MRDRIPHKSEFNVTYIFSNIRIKVSPSEIQTPKPWKRISYSITTQSPVLTISSILPPFSSHCSFIPATKIQLALKLYLTTMLRMKCLLRWVQYYIREADASADQSMIWMWSCGRCISRWWKSTIMVQFILTCRVQSFLGRGICPKTSHEHGQVYTYINMFLCRTSVADRTFHFLSTINFVSIQTNMIMSTLCKYRLLTFWQNSFLNIHKFVTSIVKISYLNISDVFQETIDDL